MYPETEILQEWNLNSNQYNRTVNREITKLGGHSDHVDDLYKAANYCVAISSLHNRQFKEAVKAFGYVMNILPEIETIYVSDIAFFAD